MFSFKFGIEGGWRNCIKLGIGPAIAVILIASPWGIGAQAANTPCSGKKGGIAECRGETFVCNDGSVSASKRSCSAYMGGAVGMLGNTSQNNMSPAASSDCSCRSGSYCTGPRGGRYCLTDSGSKSYLRK